MWVRDWRERVYWVGMASGTPSGKTLIKVFEESPGFVEDVILSTIV